MRTRRGGAPLAAFLLAASMASGGSVQQVPEQAIRISGQQRCGSCSIEVEEGVALVSPPDIGLTSRDKIAVGADATIWLAPFAMRHAILKYQADGTQSARIAEKGEGPREFLYIERIATDPWDGTLYAFGNAKLNRYTAAGEFIDTRRFPRQLLDLLVLSDGTFVVNATVPTRDRSGYIYHLVDSEGEIQRSFGPQTTGFELDPTGTRRKLAPAGPRAFWAAPDNRYELTLWTLDGTARTRIVRDVAWFRDWEGRYEPPFEHPPVPRVWDITTEDDSPYIWVLLLLPAENFAPIPRPERRTELLAPMTSDSAAFDTMIEVLDPQSGALIAQRRFPNTVLLGFFRGVRVAFRAVGEGGDQLFQMARVVLRGADGD